MRLSYVLGLSFVVHAGAASAGTAYGNEGLNPNIPSSEPPALTTPESQLNPEAPSMGVEGEGVRLPAERFTIPEPAQPAAAVRKPHPKGHKKQH